MSRNLPHRIIERHIRLKPDIKAVIDAYSAEIFTRFTVGLHVRGPGRVDGGVPELRRRFRADGGVPLEAFIAPVERLLADRPDAQVLVCSDSEAVAEDLKNHFSDRAVFYPATRSQFGEMHMSGHPKNVGLEFEPYKLGEDVLVEAHLLAMTDLLVHGNSNVVNFVLCANPDLANEYVYA